MTLRFISFSSGSCGNCSYLGYDPGDGGAPHGVLIDAGVGVRRLTQVLRSYGISAEAIDGVLLTHDHGDHIRSIGSFCKKLGVPVWATAPVHEMLLRHPLSRAYLAACRRDLVPDAENPVAEGISARYFVVPHDATETVGYRIMLPGGHRFVLMTDLGHVTPEGMAYASEADTVVIESNYDVEMLFSGHYPYPLKMRIAQGAHLSNDACAEAVQGFWHPGLRNLFLCHLSGNNNTPSLALAATRAALEAVGAETVQLRVLPRGEATPLLLL